MKAVISHKEDVAKDTLLVECDVSPERVSFKPGQYFYISLLHPPYTDARGERRHFTVVNSPSRAGILSFATRLRDSAFKKSIKELPLGTVVDVGPIEGEFVLPEDLSKPLVWIAGGIGITPFISMIRYIKENDLGYKITLIYSIKDKSSAILLDEFQSMESASWRIKLIVTVTEDLSWTGEKRRIDENFIKDHIKDPHEYTFMVSGAPDMVNAVVGSLQKLGIKGENIKKENFNGY